MITSINSMNTEIIEEAGLDWADAAVVAKEEKLFYVYYNPRTNIVLLNEIKVSDQDIVYENIHDIKITSDELMSEYAIFKTNDEFVAIQNSYNGNRSRARARVYGEFMGRPDLYDFNIVLFTPEELLEVKIRLNNMVNVSNNTIIEEEVVMINTKNTKVILEVVAGIPMITGTKGKDYTVIQADSFKDFVNGMQSEIQSLKLNLQELKQVNTALNVRITKAVAYYNSTKTQAPVKPKEKALMTPKAIIKPVDNITNGLKPVKTVKGHACEAQGCGREITQQAYDYCTERSTIFQGKHYCYQCQRIQTKKAQA